MDKELEDLEAAMADFREATEKVIENLMQARDTVQKMVKEKEAELAYMGKQI